MNEFEVFQELARLRKENEIMKKILEEHGISIYNYSDIQDTTGGQNNEESESY